MSGLGSSAANHTQSHKCCHEYHPPFINVVKVVSVYGRPSQGIFSYGMPSSGRKFCSIAISWASFHIRINLGNFVTDICGNRLEWRRSSHTSESGHMSRQSRGYHTGQATQTTFQVKSTERRSHCRSRRSERISQYHEFNGARRSRKCYAMKIQF